MALHQDGEYIYFLFMANIFRVKIPKGKQLLAKCDCNGDVYKTPDGLGYRMEVGTDLLQVRLFYQSASKESEDWRACAMHPSLIIELDGEWVESDQQYWGVVNESDNRVPNPVPEEIFRNKFSEHSVYSGVLHDKLEAIQPAWGSGEIEQIKFLDGLRDIMSASKNNNNDKTSLAIIFFVARSSWRMSSYQSSVAKVVFSFFSDLYYLAIRSGMILDDYLLQEIADEILLTATHYGEAGDWVFFQFSNKLQDLGSQHMEDFERRFCRLTNDSYMNPAARSSTLGYLCCIETLNLSSAARSRKLDQFMITSDYVFIRKKALQVHVAGNDKSYMDLVRSTQSLPHDSNFGPDILHRLSYFCYILRNSRDYGIDCNSECVLELSIFLWKIVGIHRFDNLGNPLLIYKDALVSESVAILDQIHDQNEIMFLKVAESEKDTSLMEVMIDYIVTCRDMTIRSTFENLLQLYLLERTEDDTFKVGTSEVVKVLDALLISKHIATQKLTFEGEVFLREFILPMCKDSRNDPAVLSKLADMRGILRRKNPLELEIATAITLERVLDRCDWESVRDKFFLHQLEEKWRVRQTAKGRISNSTTPVEKDCEELVLQTGKGRIQNSTPFEMEDREELVENIRNSVIIRTRAYLVGDSGAGKTRFAVPLYPTV